MEKFMGDFEASKGIKRGSKKAVVKEAE